MFKNGKYFTRILSRNVGIPRAEARGLEESFAPGRKFLGAEKYS